MFDFNDSTVKFSFNEKPDPHVYEVSKNIGSPVATWLDVEFDRKSSKFIYAMCSIDAHGFSSNFSAQFEVSFNQYKNSVTTKLISRAGAPKAYPNLLLSRDVMPDSIVSAGFSRVHVVFDPECYAVTHGHKDPKHTPIVITDCGPENGYYVLQMINTDIQELATVRIDINDLRPGIVHFGNHKLFFKGALPKIKLF